MNIHDAIVSSWDREQCKDIIKACRARLNDIACADPMVYVIKRTSERYGVKYKTCIANGGWRQTLAYDLMHSHLWAASTRKWAQDELDAHEREAGRPGGHGMKYEIIEVPKEEFKKLP